MECSALASIELLDLKLNSYQLIYICSLISLLSPPINTQLISSVPATYISINTRFGSNSTNCSRLTGFHFIIEVFFPKTMTNQNQPGVLHHFLMRNLICFSFLQSSLLRSPWDPPSSVITLQVSWDSCLVKLIFFSNFICFFRAAKKWNITCKTLL